MKTIDVVKQLQDYINTRTIEVLTYPVGLELQHIFKRLNIIVYASDDKTPEDVFNKIQSSLAKIKFDHIALNKFINTLPRKHSNNFLYLRERKSKNPIFKHLHKDSKYLIYITAYTIITNVMENTEGYVNAVLIDHYLESVPIYISPTSKKGFNSAFYTLPLNKGITVTNDPIKQDLMRVDKFTKNWVTPIKKYISTGVDTPKYTYAPDVLRYIRSNQCVDFPHDCIVLLSPIYRKFRKADLNPKALKVYLSFKKVNSILECMYLHLNTDEQIPYWENAKELEEFFEESSIKNLSKLDKDVLLWLSGFAEDVRGLCNKQVYIDWKPSNLKINTKGDLILLDILHIQERQSCFA